MKKVITISTTALAALSVFFIALSTVNIGTNQNAHAESSGAQASLILDSVIDISAPPTVTLNCTPGSTDAQAQLCTSTANVVVTTNNVTGYTLQMNAANGSPTALTNNTASPAATIPTLSQSYSSANFPINSWGYTGGLDKSGETGGYDCSTNYCPILAYESTSSNYAPNHVIKVTDAPSTASTTPITFAGKVNTTKPSGTYSTSVTFTAVTNEVPITELTDGMNMQDVDRDICGNTPPYSTSNKTYTIIDSRDDEEYIVAKLADGNCWMLDNMRLDLTDSTVLNSLTTDNTNVDAASLTSLKNGNRAAGNRYASSGFATWAQGDTTNVYPQAKANADYKNTTTTSYGAGSGKIGVYYNFCAASAGNYCYDSGAGVGNAQYDICPKNWRMPTGGSSGEHQALYTAYSSDVTNYHNAFSTTLSGSFNGGSAYDQGSLGYFWSSIRNSSSSIYRLRVSPSNVNSTDSNNRYVGYSVRCLIPGA